MNRYVLDRLMRDDRGGMHRNNGEFASDRDYNGRGRDSRSGSGRSDYAYDRAYGRDRRDSRGDRYDRRDRNDRDYNSGRDGYSDSYDDYDSRQGFEYNSGKLELPERELKEWQREMRNANGSTGARFTKEQVLQAAQNIGVKFEHFTEQEFAATVNMMYSDYCEAMKKAGLPNADRPDIYAHMAKAWLCDDDFDGEPYEKLALYYYAIVDYEE